MHKITSYGGQLVSYCDEIIKPETEIQLLDSFTTDKIFTIAAAKRSFGGQCLPPPQSDENNTRSTVLLDITELQQQQFISLVTPTEDDHIKDQRRFICPASFSFERLIREANDILEEEFFFFDLEDVHDDLNEKRNYMKCIPFNAPTSHWITIGGSIASNVHSRMSSQGYYMKDTINWFRIACPNGNIYVCSPDAEQKSIEYQLYHEVFGSNGAFGVILEVEIRMKLYSDDTSRIHLKTLKNSNDLKTLCKVFSQLQTKDNREYWNHGTVLLLFGNPNTCNGAIIAQKLGEYNDPEYENTKIAPLCCKNDYYNIFLQSFSNLLPSYSTKLQSYLVRENERYQSEYYSWMFFQNSHDDAHEYLKSKNWIPWIYRRLGCDSKLPIIHQAWLIPVLFKDEEGENSFLELYHFLRFVGTLCSNSEVKNLSDYFECQDVLYLPNSERDKSRGYYIYTATMAIANANKKTIAAIIKFFKDITTYASMTGIKPSLLKEIWCDDDIISSLYGNEISEFINLKKIVDPNNVLQSHLLNRIL